MPQVYTIATKNAFADLNDTDSEDLILSKPAEETAEVPAAQPARNESASNDGKRQSQRRNNQATNSNGQGAFDASKPSQRRPRNNGAQGSVNGPKEEGGEQIRRGPRRTAPPPTTEEGVDAPKQSRPVRRRPAERRNENAEHMGMDKLSGTGRGREMKKEGGGGHNWGNEQADFGGAEETNESDEKRKGRSDDEQGNGPSSAARSQPEVLSYDKYKAEISEKIRVADGSNEVDDEAEKQKYVQQGYEIYTKAARGSNQSQKKAENDDDNTTRPKPMHLAELAAQSGVQLRYGGDRRPKRENREEGASRRTENDSTKEDRKEYSNKSSQQPRQQSQRHEINLADKLAFPTLEAH